jgi:protein TonB
VPVARSRGDAAAAGIGAGRTVECDELAEASGHVPSVSALRDLSSLHLDPLAPRTPRLPHRRLGTLTQLAASTALHMTALVVIAALIKTTVAPGVESRRAGPATEEQVRHVVFLAPELPRMAGGGGGGGNQQPGPIRRAQGVGSDTITLRVRKGPSPTAPVTTAAAPAVEDVPPLPSIVLEAKPLVSGLFEQIGLPTGGVMSGTSTGPGSGGGVGTGIGTGTGSGRGPGLGPGSGGGTGGGVYRPGGSVSAPRLIKEVKPRYTAEALRKVIQGTVVLEVVVTGDGCPSQIHVVRSLDRGGLDEEAVSAIAQWRFEPGRLAGAPVDVLVTIMVDFSVR